MAGLFDIERLLASGLTPEALANSFGGVPSPEMPLPQGPGIPVPGGPDMPRAVTPQMIEPNPSPVAAGAVPMPRPNPLQPSPEELAGATRLGLPGPAESDVGAALAAPLPPDPTSLAARAPAAGTEGPTAPDPAEAQAQAPGGRPSLAQALKGVTAPAAPVQQKISSPNAPRATGTIKSGELQALLMALNAGGGAPAKPVRLGG